PHAVPELTALFLPLAAWTIASRRGEWGGLLAATVATVAIAVPTLVCAALWETYLWPHLLQAASPVACTGARRPYATLGGLAVFLRILRRGSEQPPPEHPPFVLEQEAPEMTALQKGSPFGLEHRHPG